MTSIRGFKNSSHLHGSELISPLNCEDERLIELSDGPSPIGEIRTSEPGGGLVWEYWGIGSIIAAAGLNGAHQLIGVLNG